ncbi:hypothetical protein [Colwellia sp. 12G3]|uniref:hypothetical protein n=1 Tax=Colwellia sp. 12G3 TaxID=2058299 RepID=UPI000C329686|nr:hypothetical protein [Colwellia sp. 12G3]PKI16372.1 hypothetical protein CXF71_09170 [Colwellia sp. 12G3]
MKFIIILLTTSLLLFSYPVTAKKTAVPDISHLVSKEDFARYTDVADFIERSPKVTISVAPSKEDIDEYGLQVAKSLTGSDCDRDGKMDDNPTCNAVFYKLWLKYAR